MLLSLFRFLIVVLAARWLSPVLTDFLFNIPALRDWATGLELLFITEHGLSFLEIFGEATLTEGLENLSRGILSVLVFFILFLLLELLFRAIQRAARIINKLPVVGKINNILGLAFGALYGLFIAVAFILLLLLLLFVSGNFSGVQEVLYSWLPVILRSLLF